MAIEFVHATASSSSVNVSSHPITFSTLSGVAAGDLGIIVASRAGTYTASATGWTSTMGPSTAGVQLALLTKVFDGSELGQTVTVNYSTSGLTTTAAVVYRGVVPDTLIVTSGVKTVSSTTMSFVSATPANIDQVLLFIGGDRVTALNTTVTHGPLTGFTGGTATERNDTSSVRTSGNSTNYGCVINDIFGVTANQTYSPTLTPSTATQDAYYTIVMSSAAVTPIVESWEVLPL